MKEIFADTAGWGHLTDQSQTFHLLAAEIYRTGRRDNCKFVTTNYIIAELVSLMTSPLRIPRSAIISFIESLKISPHIKIIHIDPDIHERAWQLLKKRQDKEWSLVDATSFVVMQQRGITEVLTTDHHFQQAGFVYLLK